MDDGELQRWMGGGGAQKEVVVITAVCGTTVGKKFNSGCVG